MKERNYKRLASFVCALVMVCTLLPLSNPTAYADASSDTDITYSAENTDIAAGSEDAATAAAADTAAITDAAENDSRTEENTVTLSSASDEITVTETNTASDEPEAPALDGSENDDTPEGRGETWDILFSEIDAAGNGKCYPVGTRIYFDTEIAFLYMDSYDAAIKYGHISGTYDEAYKSHYFTYFNIEEGKIITLADTYDCPQNYCGHINAAVKSGGYWCYSHMRIEDGDGYRDEIEFYGITSSGESGSSYSVVSFDSNGHGTAPESELVKNDEKIQKPADLEAEGYTFEGWYKEAACTTAWNFDTDTITENTVLYAKWAGTDESDIDVTLDMATMALTVGGTEILTATVTPAYAPNKNVVWSSSNPDVATVSTDGVVTAVAAGTAVITVTTEDGGKTAACTVTVNAASPTSSPITYELNEGSWASGYTAPASYTEGTGQALPTADKITKTGYIFAGWYEAADFSGSAVTEIPATATGAKTFYAKWDAASAAPVASAAPTAAAAQKNIPSGSTNAATAVPETGDNTNLTFWIVFMLAASAGVSGCVILLKRKEEKQ